MRNAAIGVAFAIVAASSPLHAQSVRGALTDSTTHEPITGVVVILFDSVGHGLSRTITDDRGRYALFRPRLAHTLRAMRIGFRPRDIALGTDSVVDVRLQTIPALLHEMRAIEGRVCGDASNSSAALEVWEQARAGLLASVVSREAMPPNVRLRTYRRTFDPVTRRLLADSSRYTDVADGRSFVAARAPWVFADYGYLHEERDGTREFYAPDESVLLDPTFAETHCLHVIDGRGPRAAQIGIAFDPIASAERDTLVDITGALWLDRASFGPRTIEFHYTNLEYGNRDSGGQIEFVPMPNGVSMIERWEIRSAMIAIDVPNNRFGLAHRPVLRRDRQDVRVLGYRRVGGQVASATWADGKRFESDLPRIQGIVKTPGGAPVRDAFVWIRDTPDTARTDSTGHFRLPPMPPGLYTLDASDSLLAPLGVSRSIPIRSLLFTGGNTEVQLEYHSRAEVFPSICPAQSYRPGTGILLARVMDSHGRPVSNARLEVETQTVTADKPETIGRRYGGSGDDGRFIVCGAEAQNRLIVRAFSEQEAAGIAIVGWGDEVVAVTLRLRPLKP